MSRKPIVVIVDDVHRHLKLFTRYFKEDYDTYCFHSGEEALKEIPFIKDIDVIISDEVMDGMGGHQFLTKAKEIHPEARRIITTAYSHEDSLLHSFSVARVHSFVRKPWEPERLRTAIDKNIEKKRNEEKIRSKIYNVINAWESTLINERRDYLLKLVKHHVAAACDAEHCINEFFSCLNRVSIEPSEIEWSDVELADAELETMMLEKMQHDFEKCFIEASDSSLTLLSWLSKNHPNIDLEFYPPSTTAKNVDDGLEESDLRTIRALVTLLAHVTRGRSTITIDLRTKVIKVSFKTDRSFGYGLKDPLCGYETQTIESNAALLSLVVSAHNNKGTLKLENNSDVLCGSLVLNDEELIGNDRRGEGDAQA